MSAKAFSLAFMAAATLMLLSGSINPTYASAQTANSSSNVQVGVWMIGVGRVDLSSGYSDLDFYLWFNSSGVTPPVSFEFMNGVASSVDPITISPSYQEYRVRGTFQNSFDFENFPFDNHQVTVEIEDKNLSSSHLSFVPDNAESGIDPDINIAGWNIQKWSAQTVLHSYPGNETYSRFVFTFEIGKSALSSIIKSVLPIAIITSIAMLAFFVSPVNSGQRIGLGVTTLLAAVASHLALIGQLPPVGYLTLADKIMITAYGLFLYSLAVSVLAMRKVDQNDMEAANRVNRRARIALPLVTLFLLLPLLAVA